MAYGLLASQVDKNQIDTNESQILNMKLQKVIGADTTYCYHLNYLIPPILLKAFTNETDSSA